MTDLDYMRMAYQLALKALGETSPNPAVGCVIVRSKEVVAKGWHRRCGGDHAEVMALKAAGPRARGATLYVTLEPCFHYGRTPPCVGEILRSGIKRVVIGMKDPNPLTNGKSIAKLRREGIKTLVGFLGDELEEMNEGFLKYVREQMPFVSAKTAQSLDGKIATDEGQSKWITSHAARIFARAMRGQFDAIMVGINTVKMDDPRLTADRKTPPLKKIILDSGLTLSPTARLFSGTDPADIIVAVTKRAAVRRVKMFLKKGVQVVCCPERAGGVDLKWLLRDLAGRGITSILIEGGASVIGSALKEKLVDKMYIYIALKIFGDIKARDAVSGIRVRDVNKTIELVKATVQPVGKDFLLKAYIKR